MVKPITKRTRRMFGMTPNQIIFLIFLGLCGCLSALGVFGIVIYTDQQNLMLFVPTEIPTKNIVTSNTPAPQYTKTPYPTNTALPTETRTPPPTPTPTLVFQRNPIDYIPTEDEMPNGFKIDTAQSSGSEFEGGKTFTSTYVSNYPNIYRTEDAYYVSYSLTVYDKEQYAMNFFNSIDEKWITEGLLRTINNQALNPSLVVFNITGADVSVAYITRFQGASVPEVHILVKLQKNNIVTTISILSHSPSGIQEKVISNANYFASLLIQKLR